MGARTGQQYLDRLRQTRPTIQVDGETVSENVVDHPAFRNVAASFAELYDLQHRDDLRDVLTYASPTSGEPVGTSFLVPRGAADLAKRRRAMATWATYSMGMLGRSGDYLNSALMALSQAQKWFGQADPAYADNIAAYYTKVRENDLLTTHTLIPPQSNRSVSGSQQGGGQLSARIVGEDDNGIIISGARMLATIAPIADEILVFPSTVLRGGPGDEAYSYAFAIPIDTPGLRFLSRQPFDTGRSHFDEPLASRFEEPDAVAIFQNVHVPWDRVFLRGHPELCNGFYTETGATVHMTHQVAIRTLAKSEFFLGLISQLAESIGIDGFGHIQEDIAEVINTVEIGQALLRAAEADAATNDHGVYSPSWAPLNTCRNWYPKVYQRFPQILRKFGASGLMALPTEADVFGAAATDVDAFLQAKAMDGRERVRLFRLAYDASVSAFAGREALYEYYFFGDPIRMATALFNSYDLAPYKKRIMDFLERD